MRFKRAAWSVVAAVAVLMSACTGSKVLEPGVSDVNVGAQANPAGADRFDTTSVTIKGILAEPADPGERAAFGNVPRDLLSAEAQFDFAQTNTIALDNSLLPAGDYQVTSVVLTQFVFQDANPPSPPVACLDNFATLPTVGLSGDANAVLTIVDFSPPVPFTIARDGTSNVTLLIDGPAITAAYLDAIVTCRTTGTCPSGRTAPCLSGFDSTSFAAAAAAAITVSAD